RYYTAATAGNQSGGNPGEWMMCESDEMVSGYRAAVRRLGASYVSDVEYQCARIVSSPVRVQRVFPISTEGRHWLHPTGSLQAALLGSLDPPQVCESYGATGLGAAVGKYLNRSNVVQTIGMFCGQPDQAQGCAQGSSPFPELKGVYGSNECQPCVALRSSSDP